MPSPKICPERLIYIYLQSREEKLVLQQKAIPTPYMSRIWLLDMAMDAIGYPPYRLEYDYFYYELYMIHPPGSNCFVNEQFSRLYWYQIANDCTVADCKILYHFLCDDLQILRKKATPILSTYQTQKNKFKNLTNQPILY